MRPLTKLIPLAAALLALPATASASAVPQLCVNTPACPDGAVAVSGLEEALQRAAREQGPADIIVGKPPGGSPYPGPFAYSGTGDNTVRIIGQGNPALTTNEVDTAALSVSGAGSKVIGVRILVPSVTSADGLALDQGAEALGVDVRRTTFGGGLHNGVTLGHGALLTSSSIEMSDGFAVELRGGTSTIDHTRIDAPRGILGGASDLHLVGSKLTTEHLGLQLVGDTGGSGITTTVVRSQITTSDPDGQGVFLRDVGAKFARTTIASTAAAPAPGTSAITYEALAGSEALNLQTTVLGGYAKTIARKAAAGRSIDLFAIDSEWSRSRETATGPGKVGAQHTNVADAEPRFVDRANGDLRLRGGDPAIDRNTQQTVNADNLTDIDGLVAVDGDGNGKATTDAGAREYRHLAPSFTAVAPAKSGAAGKPLAFAAKASDVDGENVTIKWTFGDGATATGTEVTHAYALPGIYEGSVTAVDEGGVTTSQKFPIVVTGTIAPPPPAPAPTDDREPGSGGQTTAGGTTAPAGGTDTGTGSPSGPGPVQPTGAPGDRTAPRLSSLRVTVRRSALRRGTRARLALAVDELATLRIQVVTRTGSRPLGGAITVAARPGRSVRRVRFGHRRLRALARGRAVLSIVATDAAGNRSAQLAARLRVR